MKNYVKPTIDVTTLASSAPIAAKTCVGEDQSNYDYIENEHYVDGSTGANCSHFIWRNGSGA